MKLGVTLPYTDRVPLELIVSFVQAAERLGYESVWIPEAWGWDAFMILSRLAAATERIDLGTGIVNVFSRSPALIGQAAATLDMVSGGRARLGLGVSGHQVVSGWHGMPFDRPLRRLRETMEVVRLVVARQPVTYQGEIFHLEQGLKLITHPVRPEIPIYLATITPAGVTLAGELADGWLPIFFSREYFEAEWKPQLLKGASRSGRDLASLRICVFGQLVAVTEDRGLGRNAARPTLALYLGGMGSRETNYYNRLFRSYGFEAEAETVQSLYLAGRRKEAMAAITDEMVDLVTIVGPADECRGRLADLERCGVSEVAVSLLTTDGDPAATLSALEALAP